LFPPLSAVFPEVPQYFKFQCPNRNGYLYYIFWEEH